MRSITELEQFVGWGYWVLYSDFLAQSFVLVFIELLKKKDIIVFSNNNITSFFSLSLIFLSYQTIPKFHSLSPLFFSPLFLSHLFLSSHFLLSTKQRVRGPTFASHAPRRFCHSSIFLSYVQRKSRSLESSLRLCQALGFLFLKFTT